MFCRQGSRLRPKHDVKTSLVQFLKIPNFYPLKVSCAFPRNHKMTLYHLTSRLLTIVTKICYSFMIFFYRVLVSLRLQSGKPDDVTFDQILKFLLIIYFFFRAVYVQNTVLSTQNCITLT